jgi:predicted ArsR family transcriptional regulator
MTRPQNCGSGFCSCIECHKVAWGATTDRILLLLKQEPMTKAEICRRLELTHDQVSSRLSQLKKKSPKFAKRIYISGYTRHSISGRAHIRAVYSLGDKADAKKDLKPMTQKEKSARTYVKRVKAVRNSSIFNLTLTRREIQRATT